MAVVDCKEIWNGRNIRLGERWQRTYSRIFRVRTDTPGDGAIREIQIFNGIPALYSFYVNFTGDEFDLLALCNEITAQQEQMDDPYEWRVTCNYSTRTFDPSLLNKQAGQSTDATLPTNRIPDVQWSLVPYTKPMDYDRGSTIYAGDSNNLPVTQNGYDGTAQPVLASAIQGSQPILPRSFVNSSSEPFDPPYEMDDSHLALTYRRNQAFYDPIVAKLYKDAVNNDQFLQNSPNIFVKNPDGSISPSFSGLPPGTVKCQNIGAVRKFESSTIYWEVTYEFHIRIEGWYAKILDQGFKTWPKSQSMWQVIKDQNGTISPTPVLLDGNGSQLAQGATPVYLIFFPYRELPFAPLGIV